MKGPENIDNILGGLKTKTVSMPQQATPANNIVMDDVEDKGSTISISELKEMQKDDLTVPKKSKRRNNSNKNIVSLDI